MAEVYLIKEGTLNNIANSLREWYGTTDNLTIEDMCDMLSSVSEQMELAAEEEGRMEERKKHAAYLVQLENPDLVIETYNGIKLYPKSLSGTVLGVSYDGLYDHRLNLPNNTIGNTYTCTISNSNPRYKLMVKAMAYYENQISSGYSTVYVDVPRSSSKEIVFRNPSNQMGVSSGWSGARVELFGYYPA